MNKERIKEIFSDKDFVIELVSLEDTADIQALLKTKGIELDLEQIEKAKELVEKKMALIEAGDELSDDELDEVSGGFTGAGLASLIISIISIVGGITITKTRGRW